MNGKFENGIYQDEAHANCKKFFVGCTGTGKTTLAVQMIREQIEAEYYDYIFVFDYEGQWARRFNSERVTRLDYAIAALEQSGGVFFDPTAIFNGDLWTAFKWFSQWVWDFSGMVPGNKLLICDDFPDYTPKGNDPYMEHPLSKIAGAGRRRGCDIFALCRNVVEACPLFRGSFSDYFAFQQPDEKCAKNVAGFGFDFQRVLSLKTVPEQYGEYLHLVKATGAVTEGKIVLPKAKK
jgi:hypothetical protein